MAILATTSLLAVIGHYCNQASKSLMKKPGILPRITGKFLKLLSNTIGSPRFLFRFLIKRLTGTSSTKSTEKELYGVMSRGLSNVLYAPIRPIIEACAAFGSIKEYQKQVKRKDTFEKMMTRSIHDNNLQQNSNHHYEGINEIKAGLGGPRQIKLSRITLEQYDKEISKRRYDSINSAKESKKNQKSIQSQNTRQRRP